MEDFKTNAEILSDARFWVSKINTRIESDKSGKISITSPFFEPWTRDITIGELNRRELRWREVAPNPAPRMRCLQIVGENNLLDWPEAGVIMILMRPDNLFDPPTRSAMLDELKDHLDPTASIGDTVKTDNGWAVAISGQSDLPQTIPEFSIQNFPENEIADLTPVSKLGIKKISVSSPRIDAVASKATNPSREKIKKLLSSGGVLLNYEPARKPGHELQPGDIVSVRQGGTFRFVDITGVSKKGRYMVEVEILSSG